MFNLKLPIIQPRTTFGGICLLRLRIDYSCTHRDTEEEEE